MKMKESCKFLGPLPIICVNSDIDFGLMPTRTRVVDESIPRKFTPLDDYFVHTTIHFSKYCRDLTLVVFSFQFPVSSDALRSEKS